MTNSISVLKLLLQALLTMSLCAHAAAPDPGTEDAATFDLSVPGSSGTSVQDAFDGENGGFSGNPVGGWLSWWPEDLVMAPIPSRSPELGWGLALATGYFLDLDKKNPDTPKSTIGGVAAATENKSWAAGLGGKFNLRRDSIRIKSAVGYASVNYRFYGVGNGAGEEGRSVDISQDAPLFYLSATYQVLPDTYFGLGILASTVETSTDSEEIPPSIDDDDLNLDLNISALELPFQFDTRDDELFPRSGWFVDGKALIHREALGTDFDAESVAVAVNHYRAVRARDVLAFRAYTRWTGGDMPFFLLSSFGGRTDLRGYERGRYRDNVMYAVQTEYRWQPLDRWIFTGFAGVGEVAEDYGSFFDNFLPAAGAGVRFVLSPKHKLNLSLDVGVGKHGTEFYFAIGEAF